LAAVADHQVGREGEREGGRGMERGRKGAIEKQTKGGSQQRFGSRERVGN